MGNKAFYSHMTDGLESRSSRPDRPVGVVDKSEESVTNSVEAYADGSSQPTLEAPPTTMWFHMVSSKEISGLVDGDEDI
jgi:hypothetical protein